MYWIRVLARFDFHTYQYDKHAAGPQQTAQLHASMALGRWLEPMCKMWGKLRDNAVLNDCGFEIDFDKKAIRDMGRDDAFVQLENARATKLFGLFWSHGFLGLASSRVFVVFLFRIDYEFVAMLRLSVSCLSC